MLDMIDIAELVTAELNDSDNGLLPDGVTAERQWELQMHRTDYEQLRVSVLPVANEPKENQPDVSTRQTAGESVNVHIGVQQKVAVTHTQSLAGGRAEIKYHDTDECDTIARIALAIQKAFRRSRLTNDSGSAMVRNATILSMGTHEHLQLFDVFTGVIELELTT